ncbi:DUF5906 domain-containing protein [Microcoleus sp. A006_D1]
MHDNYTSVNGRLATSGLVSVSKENPCPHCGKPDYCYRIGELSVCNRENPPAEGWTATTKTDDNGMLYYAPIQEQKETRPAQTRYWEYPARDGSRLVRVKRVDDGNSNRKITQQHWEGSRWVPGLGNIDRANIPVYRHQDVQKAIAQNQLVFIVEGEPCADLLWSLGLAATCNIGGSGKWRPTDSQDLSGAATIISPDRDEPGIKHAEQIAQDFPDAQWLYPYPDSPAWDNLPKSQGLDIADWVKDKNLSAKDLINSITPRPRTREDVVCQKYDSDEKGYIPDTAPVAEQNFVQKAEASLYTGTHWVSIGGQLYRFVGTHYELQSEAEEKRRIGNWLNTYSENVKGRYVYNRAKSSNVAEIINWVVGRTAIDPNKVNPDGLNCSNGVVRINPDGSHVLVPHSPKQVYTYVGGKYDPGADPTDCDRLLECLEESQREIFLRTAAAGLNLRLVRSKLTGRGVKGLLCYGEGSNGKDTLRAVLSAVFGQGMAGKSLSDFKSYDGGRKFALATIEGAVCNWASENAANLSLDIIQSLKQFITGDPIEIERKGKDSYEYKPTAIFLANCNKLPSITGGTAAIDDRYGILSFKKTYKRGADASQGELEADPRFKDDPDFILERIAPAMLNKMLERMPLLLAEGIDYKATREAMREAQEESRHLWQFAREVGLESDPAGKVYIGDLYKVLEKWYLENGWLTVDDSGKTSKKSWEGESVYDKPVKKSQDLYVRLKELFPKIERRVDTQERYGNKFISGLKFTNSEQSVNSSQVSQGSYVERVSSQVSSQVTCDGTGDERLTQSQPCYPCDEFIPFVRICNLLNLLTQDELQKLSKLTEAVAKVKAAKTWADVQQAIGDDAELRGQVKTALTKEENARIGKLKMTAVETT